MKLVIAFVVVLAACKKDDNKPQPAPARSAPAAAATADAAQATTATPQPCPTGPVLKDALAKALAINAGDITEISCNEITTPKQLWAVDAISASTGFSRLAAEHRSSGLGTSQPSDSTTTRDHHRRTPRMLVRRRAAFWVAGLTWPA